MKVDYTIETATDHVQVGKLDDGRTMAISMATGVKVASFNPLVAITQVIGHLTPVDRRELLKAVADRA